MKPLAQLYREHAAIERSYADEARLPNVRALHERSAARWITLAEQAEAPAILRR